MVLSYRIETLHILAWIVFISIVEKIFRAIKMDITRLQSLLSKGDNPFQYVRGGGAEPVDRPGGICPLKFCGISQKIIPNN